MIQPMFGSLGFPEMIFIFVLALLIFGPKKMPELGRTLGKAMAEFRKATTDLKRTINAEMLEQEMREADPRQIVRDSLREAKESLEKAVDVDAVRSAADPSADPDAEDQLAPGGVAPGAVAVGGVGAANAATDAGTELTPGPAEALSTPPDGPAPVGAVARGATWDDDETAPPAPAPTTSP